MKIKLYICTELRPHEKNTNLKSFIIMDKEKLSELQYLLHLFTMELPVEKQRELSNKIKAINKEIKELINL